MKGLKFKVCRLLLKGRWYANTEKGEKVVTRILMTIFTLLVVNATLLLIGLIM